MFKPFSRWQEGLLNTLKVDGETFLNYLDHLKHSGEGAPVGDGMPASAVSMLTIHKSKGLEFPVVAIPGLNAPFNRQSLHQPWMLDETIGLAGMIQPPGQTPRYPSLPLWTLKKQRQLDHLEQEKRLLYVAFTEPGIICFWSPK